MNKRKDPKPYWEMTTSELREATKEFDADFVSTTPLTPEMRRRLNRAKRQGSRRRPGKSTHEILIPVEGDLLKEVDAFAKRHGLSRSELIARALRTVMKSAS